MQTKSKFYEKYNLEKFEKYGVLVTLVLINTSIGILLISMNYFLEVSHESNELGYFSWLLISTVIIFSSIILLLNSKLNKTLENKTIKLEKISDELIKAERFSAIGELASKLAHDLRNPLSVIVASNLMINTKPTKETISENTARISRASARMGHQINHVMDFVRIRKTLLERIYLQKILKESLEEIKIPEKIIIEKTSENPLIHCDIHQLSVVFNNIILNAIQKLKSEGKIKIVYENDNENHIIKFQNSGEPIPEKNLIKIFEPLFTTKQEGTGLGLASCKQIIQQHNGEIYASNHPTTFTIKIPKGEN